MLERHEEQQHEKLTANHRGPEHIPRHSAEAPDEELRQHGAESKDPRKENESPPTQELERRDRRDEHSSGEPLPGESSNKAEAKPVRASGWAEAREEERGETAERGGEEKRGRADRGEQRAREKNHTENNPDHAVTPEAGIPHDGERFFPPPAGPEAVQRVGQPIEMEPSRDPDPCRDE